MRTRLPLLLVFLGACGGGGGDDGVGGDGPPPNGDGPDVPAMITITGSAAERSTGDPTPIEGAMIEAYRNGSDSSPVATTTTDASGNYTLTITTNGQALDGYVKATSPGLIDTYLYPPYPLTANFDGASINMISDLTFGLLGSLCDADHVSGMGTIAILVYDANMMPVEGAAVTSTPAAGKTCYNGAPLPDPTATVTAADGVAYLLIVAPGQVSVGAT